MRTRLVGCLAALVCGACALAAAETQVPKEMWGEEFGGFYASADQGGQILPGMGKKAVRGAINVVTGIVEWPMQTAKGWSNGVGFIKNKPTSKTVGALLGFFFGGPGQFASREVWGFTELVGFWTANRPENRINGVYVGVPVDAQYAWQWGSKYDMFKPTLTEGVKPYGYKLMYGLADGVAGVVELPSQIVVGVREGEPLTGVGKGLWYWWSREVYGLGGFGAIFACLASNPVDNPGYAYPGEWPWSGLTEGAKK